MDSTDVRRLILAETEPLHSLIARLQRDLDRLFRMTHQLSAGSSADVAELRDSLSQLESQAAHTSAGRDAPAPPGQTGPPAAVRTTPREGPG